MISTIGMLVFWTVQTVCVTVYVKDNTNTAAANTVVGMICECDRSSHISNTHGFILLVLFYGFCEPFLSRVSA
jgi:hypothetical protein